MRPHLRSPLFVVFNVGSGRGQAREMRQALQAGCEKAGRGLHLLEVHDPRQLPATARQAVAQARRDQGVVVAAGGDGTINAVAQATLGSGCLFGVLPQGTFNYFGRTHGIPEDTEPAVQVLLAGHHRPVQVGLVGERVFLVNASLGLYPQLLEEREGWKRQFGRSRFVAFGAGLVTLMRGHRSLRLSIETFGEGHSEVRQLRTPTLFVGNNALQMTQVGLPEAPAVGQGALAAIALRPVGRLGLLGLLVRGAFGRLGGADDLIHIATKKLTVAPGRRFTGRRIKVATDGEIQHMRLPLTFQVAPLTLELLCPPKDSP
jgi:diacylglycerol kinase family enzyme